MSIISKKIKQLKNNPPMAIVIIAFVFMFLFFLMDIFINSKHQFISGYLCNIVTEALGIIVTYFFIQKLFDKHNIEKERKEELDQILRHNEIISIYLDYYKRYFYCITTPNEKRDFKDIKLGVDFKLKDMCDLHKCSRLITVPLYKPAIELFYDYELGLRRIFEDAINNIDFKYYKEVRKLLTNFIKISLTYDVSSAIIANKDINVGKIKASDDANTMLQSDYIEDHYAKFKQNQLQSNAATPYFMLYDLLKIEQQIIIEYEALINELKSKTN